MRKRYRCLEKKGVVTGHSALSHNPSSPFFLIEDKGTR